MNVSFTGVRKFPNTQHNISVLFDVAKSIISDNKYDNIYFGCADGVDTSMLILCYDLKCQFSSNHKLIVIVPNVVRNLSDKSAFAVSKCSDVIVELHNPITSADNYNSFKVRNQRLVDECDILHAFPLRNRHTGGTWDAIRRANNSQPNKNVIINLLES